MIKQRSIKDTIAMNREEKILQYIDKNGSGIEIGPSHNPIAAKESGYNVQIIDHMTREALLVKYKDHGVNLNNIEEVDYVWQGESYLELTGKPDHYDWIIASHLIEHTPDLIGFLQNCDTILKNNGVVSLVVPDKRYCFDHFRPITGLAKIIDSHISKNTIHTAGTVAEYFLNVVSQSGEIAWSTKSKGEYELVHSLEEARQGMKSVINDKSYLDVHTWCFVPHSFRLIINDLFQLGLIPFQEVGFSPTNRSEFYITLGRNGKGLSKSRMQMLRIIESEIAGKANTVSDFNTIRQNSEKLITRLVKRFA